MLMIADSSALISVSICNCLDTLSDLFEVKIPREVYDEVIIPGKPENEKLHKYLQNKVMDIKLDEFVIDIGSLGKGELYAMALYKKLNARYILIDDSRARKVAQINGLRIMGSLGFLLYAKEKGKINAIQTYIKKLEKSNLYFSKNLLEKALYLAGETENH